MPTTRIKKPRTPPEPVDILRRYLTERGITQHELAQQLGVNPKTPSRWLTGHTRLTERRLRRVFHQLGVDPATYGLEPLFPHAPAPATPQASDLLAALAALTDRLERVAERLEHKIDSRAN